MKRRASPLHKLAAVGGVWGKEDGEDEEEELRCVVVPASFPCLLFLSLSLSLSLAPSSSSAQVDEKEKESEPGSTQAQWGRLRLRRRLHFSPSRISYLCFGSCNLSLTPDSLNGMKTAARSQLFCSFVSCCRPEKAKHQLIGSCHRQLQAAKAAKFLKTRFLLAQNTVAQKKLEDSIPTTPSPKS